MAKAAEARLVDDNKWLQGLSRELSHQVASHGIESNVLDAFEKFVSGCFLAEADGFQLYLFNSESRSNLLADLLEAFNKQDNSHQQVKLMRGLLQRHQPRTFGVELTELMLMNNSKGIPDFIRLHSKDFAKIPPSRCAGVLAALGEVYEPAGSLLSMGGMPDSVPSFRKSRESERIHAISNGMVQSLRPMDLSSSVALFIVEPSENMKALDSDLRAILQPLVKGAAEDLEQMRQRLAGASSLASLNLTPESCLDLAVQVLDQTAAQDSGKGLALAHQVDNLISACPAGYAADISALRSNWRDRAAGIPEMFSSILLEDEKQGGVISSDRLDRIRRNFHFMDAPRRVLNFLRSAGCLDEAPRFRAYRIRRFDYTCTLLNIILNGMSREGRETLAAMLKKEPQTFGVELISCLLARKEEPLREFARRRAGDLGGLSVEQQSEVAMLMGLRGGSWLQLAAISPEWNAALLPVLPAHRARISDSCKTLMAASKLEDIRQSGRLDEDWLDDISEMTLNDPALGKAAFEHVLLLARQAAEHEESGQDQAGDWLRRSARFPVLAMNCMVAAKDPGRHAETVNDVWNEMLHCTNHPREVMAFMEAAGFMADASRIDAFSTLTISDWSEIRDSKPVLNTYDRELWQLFEEFLHKIVYNKPNEASDRLMAYARQRQPKTFGAELISAMINQAGHTTSRPQSDSDMARFIVAHAADWEMVPEKSRKQVLAWLHASWENMPQGDAMPPDILNAMQPLLGLDDNGRDNFIEKVMLADNLQGVGLAHNDLATFYARVWSVLPKLWRTDRHKAMQFFFKSNKVVQGSSYCSDLSEACATLVKKFSDIQAIAFMHEFFAEYQNELPPYAELARTLGLAEILWKEWMDAGGEAFPGRAMDAVLRRLAESMPETPVALTALDFANFFEMLSQTDRVALVQWAEAQPPDHRAARFVRELAVAGRLFLEYHPAANEGRIPWPGAMARQPGHEALWDHYRKAMLDEKLPAQMRVALSEHLCGAYPLVVPAEISEAGIKLFVATPNGFNQRCGLGLESLLRSFSELPIDESWRESARKLRDVRGKTRHMFEVNTLTCYDDAMLQIALRLNEDDWINELLEENKSLMLQSRASLGALIYNGGANMAVEALKENFRHAEIWRQKDNFFLNNTQECHGLRLPSRFDQARSSLKWAPDRDEAATLVAGYCIIDLFDPPAALASAMPGFVSRDKRLEELADRLLQSRLIPPDKQLFIALELADQNLDLAPRLEKIINPPSARPYDVRAIVNDPDRGFKVSLPLAYSLAKNIGSAGSGEALGVFEAMRKCESVDAYFLSERLWALCYMICKFCAYRWQHGQNRDFGPYQDLCKGALSKPVNLNGGMYHEMTSMGLALAAWTDGGTEAWRQGITADLQKRVRSSLRHNMTVYLDVWDFAAALAGKADSKQPLEKRRSLVRALLKDPWVQGATEKETCVMKLIVEHFHILTLDEMFDSADELTSAWARDGRNAAEIAEMCLFHGNRDRAISCLKIASTQAEKNPAEQGSLKLRIAALLICSGNVEEAARIISENSESALDEHAVKLRAALR